VPPGGLAWNWSWHSFLWVVDGRIWLRFYPIPPRELRRPVISAKEFSGHPSALRNVATRPARRRRSRLLLYYRQKAFIRIPLWVSGLVIVSSSMTTYAARRM